MTNKSVKISSEVGITLQIAEYQFIRFSHSQERIVPNDNPATLKRAEQELYEKLEEIVEKRTRRLKRIIREAEISRRR